MPFFIKNVKRRLSKSEKEKKRVAKKVKVGSQLTEESSAPTQPRAKRHFRDDEIESDSEEGSAPEDAASHEDSESESETAAEKRLRLAKKYLAEVKTLEEEQEEVDEMDHDAIGHRLQQDLLEQTGHLKKFVADDYLEPVDHLRLRGHDLSLTCLVVSSDGRHIFSGAKDSRLIKWDAETGRKVKVVAGGRRGTEDKHVGHTTHILSIAISSDNRFLVSGDCSSLILVWRPDTLGHLGTLKGHRGPVSGVAFRRNTDQLFSGSHDRTVKIWNVQDLAFVETLFGHLDKVTAIDSFLRDRAVSTGGRDNSVRVWKVLEESQLVFNAHRVVVDCLALINDENFITGADDGSLSLWFVAKKRPLCIRRNAHGPKSPDGTRKERADHDSADHDSVDHDRADHDRADHDRADHDSAEGLEQYWISSVAALTNTDLVASGSRDGFVKLWKCGAKFNSLTLLHSIVQVGFVNSLQFSCDGSLLVAGIGQEHKFGRWWSDKKAQNSIRVYSLQKKQ